MADAWGLMLSPAWLFAFAAVVIPVAIHLWNIRPGKTLKVGSIMLMDQASRKSSRSFKVSEVLLLILRCLLLAAIAVFLAGPVWTKFVKNKGVKGWILIPKEVFNETYQQFKPEIDTLTKRGYEFHYYNQRFPKGNLTELLAQPRPVVTDSPAKAANYWQLLLQLNQQAPADLPIALFTPNGINHFSGHQPATPLKLDWQVYTLADSVSTWLAAGWLTNNGSIRLVQGTSRPTATSYTNFDVKTDASADSPFQINVDNGKMIAAMKQKNGGVVTVDADVSQTAIFADKNQADAGYIKAAITSVNEFTQQKSVVKIYTDASVIPANQNWIFWLSEQRLPDGLLKKAKHLFVYEPGKVKTVNTWMTTGDQYSITQRSDQIKLFKRVDDTGNSGELIWHDGFGKAVLGFTPHDSTKIYHFYSRFNPGWNELVWSDEFPKMMLNLVTENKDMAISAAHERRTLTADQIRPVSIMENHPMYQAISEQTDLSHYFWIVLVLIFIVERWLAHQTKLSPTNG